VSFTSSGNGRRLGCDGGLRRHSHGTLLSPAPRRLRSATCRGLPKDRVHWQLIDFGVRHGERCRQLIAWCTGDSAANYEPRLGSRGRSETKSEQEQRRHTLRIRHGPETGSRGRTRGLEGCRRRPRSSRWHLSDLRRPQMQAGNPDRRDGR